MACNTTALLLSTTPPLYTNSKKVRKNLNCSCAQPNNYTNSEDNITNNNDNNTPQKFSYNRASASSKCPNSKLSSKIPQPLLTLDSNTQTHVKSLELDDGVKGFAGKASGAGQEVSGMKMSKLGLIRDKNWRERVGYFVDRILGLEDGELVGDVLDDRTVQMTPTDFCFVVKGVGRKSWRRALEIYEWLNLRKRYRGNARMLATVLAVLGKGNQEGLAVEIFRRGELEVGNTVQVYNSMMGVYARNGRFSKVQELLGLMRERGCVPDLVSFNTLINARLKSGPLEPDLALDLLKEVRRARLRPDIITYNTLLSACSRDSNMEEAMKVYNDMERSRCRPDLWTYNAMISVYGRCGMCGKAEQLFHEMKSEGFVADAVTYNSLLYAFAREEKVEKVKAISKEMLKEGFDLDEMAYNTIIHMYGKQGQHELAFETYREMKLSGRRPDVVTYTVLVDFLGKSNKMTDAENFMSEMLDAGVKPNLHVYSALISGYAKSGKLVKAEETYNLMLRSGIQPDHRVLSVMLDIILRMNETEKGLMLYRKMIIEGYKPDNTLYKNMLRAMRENDEIVGELTRDMEKICLMDPQIITSILVEAECYDQAAQMLKSAINQGLQLRRENLVSILSSYSASGRHTEACDLLEVLRDRASGSNQLITQALVVMLCKANKLDDALKEYSITRSFGWFNQSPTMYETMIQCCKENELYAEALQIFSDMKFFGIKPSTDVCQYMVCINCKMDFPETAHHLVDQAIASGIQLSDDSIYVDIIEAYGKLKLWQKAESLVGIVRKRFPTVSRKIWDSLIQAYAASGYYERARAIFNTMMRHGPSPSIDSINGLLQALISDGRLDELLEVTQELQDLGFKISKSSIVLMLEAFANAGNMFEVKKIYHGMKAAGYLPTMHLYKIIIPLFCKWKRIRDAEAMVSEMREVGFKPDLSIWNIMLKMYAEMKRFKEVVDVYQQIQNGGLKPDDETYNIMIIAYCRNQRPEEGLILVKEMRNLGLDPKLDTYKSLISAFGKQKMLDQAEKLFEELRSNGYKLDRSFYHTMMKMFRNCGDHYKAKKILAVMKEDGVEPRIATMNLLMTSYGSCGQPLEAEEILDDWRNSGFQLSILPYKSVIDAYLWNGDYNTGIQKLLEMRKKGLEPDHKIWACFIRAASLFQHTTEAIILLNALQGAGFDLPIRFLTEETNTLVTDIHNFLANIEQVEENAAFEFVNALEDLLWAFELRATASWVFQLAVRMGIYSNNVFRVADKDWGADFRKLSGGAALVGLTLWLDCMQDASLKNHPESSKSIVLITGAAEYNNISVNSTIKAFLWEMGSPFLPCKPGVFVAKAHSLRMWLKDSPFCLDLELKDAASLPELNSMQLIDGCFMRRGLVPAFKEITERLGLVRPKKFAKLALLSSEQRIKTIEADLEGRKQKLEKLKNNA